jgi:flagellar motor switch protein FliM
MVPSRSAGKVDLASRRSALEGIPIRLDAIMDFGSVNLAQLTDLRVGELLIGDTELGDPLSMRIKGGSAAAKGYLRRTGTKRAVMLDGLYSQEEHKS